MATVTTLILIMGMDTDPITAHIMGIGLMVITDIVPEAIGTAGVIMVGEDIAGDTAGVIIGNAAASKILT